MTSNYIRYMYMHIFIHKCICIWVCVYIFPHIHTHRLNITVTILNCTDLPSEFLILEPNFKIFSQAAFPSTCPSASNPSWLSQPSHLPYITPVSPFEHTSTQSYFPRFLFIFQFTFLHSPCICSSFSASSNAIICT